MTDADSREEKLIVLDPARLTAEAKSQVEEAVQNLIDLKPSFQSKEFTLGYADWSIKACLKAVLPEGLEFR